MSMKVCDIGIRLKILGKQGQKAKGVGEEEEGQRGREEERSMFTGTSGRQKRGRRGKGEGDGERRGERMERRKGRGEKEDYYNTADDENPLHHHITQSMMSYDTNLQTCTTYAK